MSKQNSKDSLEENDQSLPRKKLKVGHEEESAVRTEATVTATATATATAPVPPSMDPALLAYLKDNFDALKNEQDAQMAEQKTALKNELYVLKNEHDAQMAEQKTAHDALKHEHDAQMAEQKTAHDALKNEQDAQRAEQTKLKKEVNSLHARMDHLAGAFEPATTYALFESAIYAFVAPVIPKHFEESAEMIKYAVSLVCRKLFCSLKSPGKSADNKPFHFQNPNGEQVPPDSIHLLVLRGIAGLVAFVESQDSSTLLTLDAKARGLDAVFSTPPSKKTSATKTSYGATKRVVKSARQEFRQSALNTVSMSIEDAVSRTVDALRAKDFDIEETVKEKNIKGLKKMCKK